MSSQLSIADICEDLGSPATSKLSPSPHETSLSTCPKAVNAVLKSDSSILTDKRHITTWSSGTNNHSSAPLNALGELGDAVPNTVIHSADPTNLRSVDVLLESAAGIRDLSPDSEAGKVDRIGSLISNTHSLRARLLDMRQNFDRTTARMEIVTKAHREGSMRPATEGTTP